MLTRSMSAAADEAGLPLIASLPPELFDCVCLSCSLQSVARLACTSQRLRAMSYRGDLPLMAPETAKKKVDGGKVLYWRHDGKVVLARWAADRGASAAVVTALLVAHGTVEAYAFYMCTALKTISIPEPVEAIGWYAFAGCSALESITLPACVQTMGNGAFLNCCALESVTLPPASVQTICDSAFRGCCALKSITLPASVQTIGQSAFEKCSALETITLPASVQAIGNGAFRSCHALETITLPASVQTMGYKTFYNCFALKSITLPRSLEGQMEDARLTTPNDPWDRKPPGLRVTFT